ncbi:MAG: hypothetical protein KDI69_05715 [Xanthomonadales bacterium]|nr:hypothetical protein [Xanthomonadales bacterium]
MRNWKSIGTVTLNPERGTLAKSKNHTASDAIVGRIAACEMSSGERARIHPCALEASRSSGSNASLHDLEHATAMAPDHGVKLRAVVCRGHEKNLLHGWVPTADLHE